MSEGMANNKFTPWPMPEPAHTEQDLREAQNFIDCRLRDKTAMHAWIKSLATEFSRIRREARAGMREACANVIANEIRLRESTEDGLDHMRPISELEIEIRKLPDLAADEAIERIHDEAHEVALSLAAEQIIGALREGGNFAEGSPLAKVMQVIERIKREARLDYDELKLAAWHARVMKLANEMEHYGHVTHYPAMCAKCRLLALLGDLK